MVGSIPPEDEESLLENSSSSISEPEYSIDVPDEDIAGEAEGEFQKVVSESARRKERKMAKKKDTESKNVEQVHLHFPPNCPLTNQDRRDWFDQLCLKFGDKVKLKRGVNRLFVICEGRDLANKLLNEEFKGITLSEPPEKRKKIIIKNFSLYDDPEIFLQNPSIRWVQRIVKSGRSTRQLIAGYVGVVPQTIIDFPDKSYGTSFNVEEFCPPTMMCFKCSKWNHCESDCSGVFRCRFCAENHDSRICSEKIKNGVSTPRVCANCGGPHNARSFMCRLNPNSNRGNGPVSPSGLDSVPDSRDFPDLSRNSGLPGASAGGSAQSAVSSGDPIPSGSAQSLAPPRDLANPWSLGQNRLQDQIQNKDVEDMKKRMINLEEEIKNLSQMLLAALEKLNEKEEGNKSNEAAPEKREDNNELKCLYGKSCGCLEADNEEVKKVVTDISKSSILPRGVNGVKVKGHITFLRKNGNQNRVNEFYKEVYHIRSDGRKLQEIMLNDHREYGGSG